MISYKKHWQSFFIILILTIFTSCSEFKITKPEGFAEIKEKGSYRTRGSSELYRAVSPEGMILKIRKEKNYPPMELEFWAKTLQNHLIKEGYILISEQGSFETETNKGMFFEWGLPYGNEDYIYLTALLVFDKEIIIGETAALQSIYKNYRSSIIESLKSIIFK